MTSPAVVCLCSHVVYLGLPAIVAILTGSVEGLLGSDQSSVSDV